MNLHHEGRRTQKLQIGFLVLLAVCTAQLGWWLLDQVMYTREVQVQMEAGWRKDVTVAREMLRIGATRTDVQRLYPDLQFGPDSVSLDPAVLGQLDRARFRRLNRYAWEGAFFLAVLLGAMAIVYRALRDQAELHRRQEDFLATFSHELKSPLASVRLSAETLSLRDPPAERRAELVARLLQDLARLNRLIGNILDASRLSASVTRTSPEPLLMTEEVRAVVEEVTIQAAESGTTITVDIPEMFMIRADREAVHTVLRNLLQNAIRAAAGGTVAVSARVVGGWVHVEVRDDGIGFDPAVASRLFGKFYRPEVTAPSQRGGAGLGLYLVRSYAELDGGTVGASSEGPGRGATFTVNWPLSKGGLA